MKALSDPTSLKPLTRRTATFRCHRDAGGSRNKVAFNSNQKRYQVSALCAALAALPLWFVMSFVLLHVLGRV
jgi:hypothetical protein